MKEKLKRSPLWQRWFYTQSPLVITRPALKETLWCVGYLLGGFVLACGQLWDQPAPFALAFLAVSGGGVHGLACLLGAIAGFLGMQPFSQGLERISAGILIYVCSYIFGSQWVTKRAWFPCLTAGGMSALVGAIFLLGKPMGLQSLGAYALLVAGAAIMPLSYASLLQHGKTAGALLAISTGILGLARIPMPWGLNLGGMFSVALMLAALRRGEMGVTLAMAVSGGIAMDAWSGGIWTMALGFGALLGSMLSKRLWVLRIGTGIVSSALIFAVSGQMSLSVGGSLLLGLGLSLLLPAGLLMGQSDSAAAHSAARAERQLVSGQRVLLQLYEAIGVDPIQQEDAKTASLFDRSAAKVCRRCTRREICWEQEAGENYQMLRPALERMRTLGGADKELFPRDFAEKCLHLERLIDALNQELECGTAQRRTESRRQEDRIIASRYLLHLGNLLGNCVRSLRMDTLPTVESYSAKLGVYAQGRNGSRWSGDRGVSFHTEDGRFFVLLCDGAGSGQAAAGESLLAVDALAELIQAGMPAGDAMELLGGMYLLRDQGTFSTMDVLELSLLTGQGTLYKWGAASSYVKAGNAVKQIGAAALPPGFSTAQTPEVIQLDLWNGDLLVMVSDGVAGESAMEEIRGFSGDNVKTLAKALVQRAEDEGSVDDMTAAVIRVEELKTRNSR